jgi:hypothetical protein
MHPTATRYLYALLAVGAAAATPAPCLAQSAVAFAAWGARLQKPASVCPTAPVPAQQNDTNPFFAFNGDATVPNFSCQQIGPFPSLNTPHGPWFMQNVKGLKPKSCKQLNPCRVNAARMCSLNSNHGPSPTGPFGGGIGPAGCEALWTEEVAP